MNKNSESTIPFVVGVSGHRNPKSPKDVKKQCKRVFEFINKRSRDTPKILLSGMAEGADQIAAKVALESGWQVIAVLPMPYSEYRKDFNTPAQIELDELLTKCIKIIELPIATTIDSDITKKRQQQYRNLGIYLVQHSQLMMLCWDGNDNMHPSPGGTLEVKKLCEAGVSYVSKGCSILQPQKRVEKVYIYTPRAGASKHKIQIHTHKKYLPKTLKLINRFNKSTANLKEQTKQSKLRLLDNYTTDLNIQKQLSPLLEVYAAADSTSITQHRTRNKAAFSVISVLFLALLFHSIYGGLRMSLLNLTLYISLISTGWIIYHWFFKFKHMDMHYLDYRSLAEGLRVQIFWNLYGLDESVSDHYLYSCSRETHWISESIRNLQLLNKQHLTANNFKKNPKPIFEDNNSDSLRKLVRRKWIEDQRNYFIGSSEDITGKAGEHKAKARKAQYQVKAFLILGTILTLLILGIHILDITEYSLYSLVNPASEALNDKINYLLFGVVFCFGIAAATALYAEIQGHSERAESYFLAGKFYSSALQKYDQCEGDQNMNNIKNKIIFELGKEALAENANWLINHRKTTQSFGGLKI